MTGADSLGRVVLAITGSSAAAGAPWIVAALRQQSAEMRVLLSRSAEQFVTRTTVELHAGSHVYGADRELTLSRPPHMEIARWADLFVVAPATAHVIGRVAAGLCDDLITTAILATRAPVVFAPSMNEDMWLSRVVQRNARILEEELGYHVLGPALGPSLSDDQPRLGALPAPDVLLQFAMEILRTRSAK